MEEIIKINITDVVPDITSVSEVISGEAGFELPDEISNMIDFSLKEFTNIAFPKGILKELSKEKFAEIFNGEGNNDTSTPVGKIYPDSDDLSLFAVTVGIEITEEIKTLFSKGDYAEGYILDTVASCAADKAADFTENYYRQKLIENNIFPDDFALLRYSPGYCGWNIEGQKKLFSELKPEKIGITLNESCLMTPIKSVSGVLISGKKEIHKFENNFSFCPDCKTISCKVRMKSII